jgi:TRAP-type C4-dicarboxylate transport system substrate-binding protein
MKNRGFLFTGIFLVAVLLIIPMSATAEMPTVKWRMQSVFPPPETVGDTGIPGVYGSWARFTRRVGELSDGKFTIKIFVPNALFKRAAIFGAVKAGAIEIAGFNGYYCCGEVPEGTIDNGLLYGNKNYAQLKRLLFETDYVKLLRKGYANHNIYYMSGTVSSSTSWMTTFAFQSMDDISGKKIGVSGVRARFVKAIGGTPVDIGGGEMYSALQRRTIDGVNYPPYCGVSYKLFEVVKYQSWPPNMIGGEANIIINMNAWKKLPKEYQNILQKAVDEMQMARVTKEAPALDKYGEDQAPKWNVKNVYHTDEQFRSLQKAALPLWDQIAKKNDNCARLVEIYKKNCGIK